MPRRTNRLAAWQGQARDLLEGEGALAPVHVRPLQGALVGLFLGDDVEHVVGEVEVFRDVDAEIVQVILVGAEIRLSQKALVKRHKTLTSGYLMTTAMKRQSASMAYMAWGMAES